MKNNHFEIKKRAVKLKKNKSNADETQAMRLSSSVWKVLMGGISGAVVISLIIFILALVTPTHLEHSRISATIDNKIYFNVELDLKKSTLFPNGGKMTADRTVLSEIVKQSVVNTHWNFRADQEVEIKGVQSLKYILEAPGKWKKETPLFIEEDVLLSGYEGIGLSHQYDLDLKGIAEFIKKVEEETQVGASDYKVKLIWSFEGVTLYEGHEKETIIEIPYNIEFNERLATLPEVYEFNEQVRFMEDYIIPNEKSILFTTNVLVARKRAGVLMVVLILSWTCVFYQAKKRKVFDKTEQELIIKRFGTDLVDLTKPLCMDDYEVITIVELKAFHSIAQKRDAEVLHWEDVLEHTYAIIDEKQLYVMKSTKLQVLVEENNEIDEIS